MARETLPELAAFLTTKAAGGLRPRSLDAYRERLTPILRDLGPLPNREEVLSWLVAWQKRKEPAAAYYRGVVICIRAYLHHHGRELDIPLPSVPEYEGRRLSAEEVQRVLSLCRQGCGNGRDYAILVLMLDTGLRASELTGLRWRDMDLDGKQVAVRGKGGRPRFAYFGAASQAALLAWQGRAYPSEYVFATRTGSRMSRGHLWVLVERWGRKAGLRLHPHMLRRTFATQWVMAGGNSLVLQRLLGHSTLTMVQRYVSLAETDLALANGQRGVLDGIL